MKKIFLQIIVFSSFLSSQAQLEVSQNGGVSLGINNNSTLSLFVHGRSDNLYGMAISGSSNQIWVRNRGSNSGIRRGVHIDNKTDSTKTYGIWINPSGNGTGNNYGIKSIGGNSSSLSCGVMGGLNGDGITCGAGIIGSSSSNLSITSQQYTGKYAGFFQGDVRVTGTLYGNILTPTTSSGSMNNSDEFSVQIVSSSTDMTDEGVSNKLKQIPLLKINNISNNRSSRSNETELTNSQTFQSLMDKMDNGYDLTEEEMILFDNEIEAMEAREAEQESPQTRMSSIRYGLDADQLKMVYPELVYEDKNGNVSVNYIEMVPLLVQSINELQERIDVLEKDNKALRAELSENYSEIKSRDGASDIEPVDINILSLSQNDPNPFSERTTITLNIPEDITTAAVFFYDMSGKQIDKRMITEREKTQISVTSADFSEGMYLYSLIADGKVIATRKMILTK